MGPEEFDVCRGPLPGQILNNIDKYVKNGLKGERKGEASLGGKVSWIVRQVEVVYNGEINIGKTRIEKLKKEIKD
ncbi:hypothetical protein LguiB_021107 [Lonicera macranthoides]